MRTGINQIMLLKRAKMRGYVTPSDVAIVYNMPNPRDEQSAKRQRERKLIILQKLELHGLLKHIGNGRFILTEKGESFLHERVEGGDICLM